MYHNNFLNLKEIYFPWEFVGGPLVEHHCFVVLWIIVPGDVGPSLKNSPGAVSLIANKHYKTEFALHTFKGTVHPKIKIVIIYSPLCCSISVWLYFICVTIGDILSRIFFQWGPVLFRTCLH